MKNLRLIVLNLLLCVIMYSCSSDDAGSNPETSVVSFTNTLTINDRSFTPDSLMVTKNTISRKTSLSFDIINRNPNDISKQEGIHVRVEHHKDSLSTGTYTIDTSFENKELNRVIVRNTRYETGTLNVIGQTKSYSIEHDINNNIIKVIDHGDKVYTIEIDAYFEYENQNSGGNSVEKERVHIKGVFKNEFKDFRDILGI